MSKYKLEDIVTVLYKNYRPGEEVKSIIIGIRKYTSRHFIKDLYIESYCCSPLELEGFEHDDEEWIPEAHCRALHSFPGIPQSLPTIL